MADKITTLYKGDKKRRVGTAKERRQLLAAGWSEKAPQAPQQASQKLGEATVRVKPSPAAKPQPKPKAK